MNAIARTGRVLPDLTERSEGSARRTHGRIDDPTLRRLFAEEKTDCEIAAHFGCHPQTVLVRRSLLRLKRRKGRRLGMKLGPKPTKLTLSRHAPKPLSGHVGKMLPIEHPALTERRTIYPSTVVPVEGLPNVLVSGGNSWKIGSTVQKGRWAGFPIFTLTIEERATCPTSCGHWRSCYGNAMHLAKRIAAGPAFEARLALEVAVLASRYPAGFAVRLHVLGDFYSERYVALWREMVEQHPNLHVFRFSARIDGDGISAALARLVCDRWPRFAIRFSNGPVEICSTVTIEHPLQKPATAIVCPAQVGKTASCATCALCWSTERPIAFLRH